MATPTVEEIYQKAGIRYTPDRLEAGIVAYAIQMGIDPGSIANALHQGSSSSDAGIALNKLIQGYQTLNSTPDVPAGFTSDPSQPGVYRYDAKSDTSRLTSPDKPSDWGSTAGFIKLGNGNYFDPTTHMVFDSQGNVIDTSNPGSNASGYAQADLYRAQAQKLRDNAARAGTPVPGLAGYIYDSDGNPIDASLTKADVERNNALRASQEHDDRMAQLGISQEGNRLRGQELDWTRQFQGGQLENEKSRLAQEGAYQQETLAQGRSRLEMEARQMANDNAIKAQQNALAKQQYIGKVLSSPSDFIARAFMQRGLGSPTKQITQADLINQINAEYQANPVTFQAPTTTPGAPAPQQYAEGTPAPSATATEVDPATKKLQTRVDSIGKLLQHVESTDTMHRLVDELGQARSRLASTDSTQYGTVNDKQAIVGDPQTPGVPNPEMVLNPTGAPISVVPMNKMGGRLNAYAGGTGFISNINMPDTQYSNKTLGPLGGFGNYDSTSGQPLAGTQTIGNWYDSPYLSTGLAPGVKSSITGSGIAQDYVIPTAGQQSLAAAWNRGAYANIAPSSMTFADWIRAGQPRVNNPANQQTPEQVAAAQAAAQEAALAAQKLKQQQLIDDAESTLPPAVRALFGDQYRQQPRLTTGGTENPANATGVSPLRFGFNLFSPQTLAALTPAEMEALNSYLGVKYNTTLEDVNTAMQQTFGKPQAARTGRLSIG